MARREQGRLRFNEGGVATYELTDEMKEKRGRFPGTSLLDDEIFDPSQKKRIPKAGAWVMLLRIPNIQIQKNLCRGQIFFAKQAETAADSIGFDTRGMYKIQIFTPWGECCLWPYEYSVPKLDDVLSLWDSKELIFHPFQGEPRMTDVLSYIRSRGIGLAQALPMALGSFTEPVGWFDVAEEIRESIEATFGR